MLSEALQRNAKHEVRLSNISGLFKVANRSKINLGLKARPSGRLSAALQLRFDQNDTTGPLVPAGIFGISHSDFVIGS